MKQNLFKVLLGVLTVTCLGMGILLAPQHAQAYQDPSTPTGVVITVTYTEAMNVRGGPGTSYDILGQIQPGSVFPALGISPGREWIQIAYPGGPNGIGWVYSSYVSISGGELRIVEPPPTQTPLVTSTFDPTLAAAFIIQPTQTRMPTFTPPPPLTIPQFTETAAANTAKFPSGIFAIILGILGSVGLLVSLILRKQ
jgi:uncharacterized protein YraI